MSFIPEWAEKTLSKPEPFDVAELEALREFYEAWHEYHLIPNDKLHKSKQKEAAIILLAKHEAVYFLRHPKRLITLQERKFGH